MTLRRFSPTSAKHGGTPGRHRLTRDDNSRGGKRGAGRPRGPGRMAPSQAADPAAALAILQWSQARTAEKVEGARMRQLKRQRLAGELCSRQEADAAMVAIVSAVRASLGRATGYLPSDLTTAERTRCDAAIRSATLRTLADAAEQLNQSQFRLESKS